MSVRICHLCGQPAAGYASVWTAATGERWYCHGDEDEEATCYMRAQMTTTPAPNLSATEGES